ncbi:response regulator [Tenuifilum thalassicum]|uniref:Response regulator transcription factor n=1 Tax=Tenuifilum thalassicum TaxID=2590900 RepID=A0A7D4BEH9_9BACT|nr:response regulator transcription factor [Tenuifilum thalassicum]QKG79958.1 response regulator transcription factor [Tenuifilum thalassicum]
MNGIVKILIADDHPIVRKGLSNLIKENLTDIDILQAENHAETIKIALEQKPTVVLLDVAMPKGNAIETIEQIKGFDANIKILVVTMHNDNHFAMRMVKSGADGYITKDTPPVEMIGAVKRLLSGKRYITPELVEMLTDIAQGKQVSNTILNILSNREYEVFLLIAKGKTVSEIAQMLNLSVKTISTHRSRIIEKTGLKNNSQIMLFALQNGII